MMTMTQGEVSYSVIYIQLKESSVAAIV